MHEVLHELGFLDADAGLVHGGGRRGQGRLLEADERFLEGALLLFGDAAAAQVDGAGVGEILVHLEPAEQLLERRALAHGEARRAGNGARGAHHDGAAGLVGQELHHVLVLKDEGLEFGNAEVAVEGFAVAGAGHAGVGGGRQEPAGAKQACARAPAAGELVAGRLAQQAKAADAGALFAHEHHVARLHADAGQRAGGDEAVEVHGSNDAAVALDLDPAVGALGGQDAARAVEIVHDAVVGAAGVAAGLGHVAGHEDCHGLGVEQVGVDVHVAREDRGELLLDGALELAVLEAAHAHRTNFGDEDVALLVDHEHVVVGHRAPDA